MAYFLKKTPLRGKSYLQLVDGVYDPKTKAVKQLVFKKLGYLEDLLTQYKDPVAFFKEEAKRLNEERTQSLNDKYELKIPVEPSLKNLGYFPVKRLVDEMNLTQVINNLQYGMKLQYKLSDVFEMLLYSRIIDPSSKLDNYMTTKSKLVQSYPFSISQMYDAIERIGMNEEALKQFYLFKTPQLFKRNVKNVYFDCTNFYFEIDQPEGLKQNGPSKEDRKAPIIGLGLLLDGDGIPLNYNLYPGNESEKPVMREVLHHMKVSSDITGRVIRIADKGLNCGDNIYDALKNKDGYIYSQTVKGASHVMKQWILNEKDYRITTSSEGEILYKIKSFIDDEATFTITREDGTKAKVKWKQKQIVFYSKNFADKQKIEREKLIHKAEKELNSPSLYKQKIVGNEAKYIKEDYVNDQGEILDLNPCLSLDHERIDEDSALDGYYLLVTSEVDAKDEDIISAYRTLWEIEESFRITKSQLKARPVFVSKEHAIRGHFLICFYALSLLRIIEKKKLNNAIGISSLIETMRNYVGLKISDTDWQLTYVDKNIPILAQYYSVSLDRLFKKDKDIKKLFNLK